jgi:hypothetical protein
VLEIDPMLLDRLALTQVTTETTLEAGQRVRALARYLREQAAEARARAVQSRIEAGEARAQAQELRAQRQAACQPKP